MNTPICDFTADYAISRTTRFHVPGHKGHGNFGVEAFDITEIAGADDLFNASGIIAKSEKNATKIFNSRQTFYSAEGSSLCIRAMLYLAKLHAKSGTSTILATRNVHKSFLFGCALLDITPTWIYGKGDDSYINCTITHEMLSEKLKNLAQKPIAVFVTAPDYLGQSPNLKLIADVCKNYDVPLIVDNAHGAYLHFINDKNYIHPLKCGADMCCDSAHKTLPVLTGGAYLHIGKSANMPYEENARNAMALFASTSPSYLILCSLDRCNKMIFDGYDKQIKTCVKRVKKLKKSIKAMGFCVPKCDPMRIVINTKSTLITAKSIAREMRKEKIEPELCDDCNVVLMISANNTEKDFVKLEKALKKALKKPTNKSAKSYKKPKNIADYINSSEKSHANYIADTKYKYKCELTPRQALFSPCISVPIETSIGEICAMPAIFCPPAVPIIMCGEIITIQVYDMLKNYGFTNISIVDTNSI